MPGGVAVMRCEEEEILKPHAAIAVEVGPQSGLARKFQEERIGKYLKLSRPPNARLPQADLPRVKSIGCAKTDGAELCGGLRDFSAE